MSGHLRFCFIAFFLAGLSSPASSNPFDALFNSAPAQATEPAPAKDECVTQPGKSTADGQRWVYRYLGHRRCWFQAAEETVKKPIHRVTRHGGADPNENGSALRNPIAVVDASKEPLSPAPMEAPQPTPPRAQLVDAAPVRATGSATLIPPAPVVAKPVTDGPADRPRTDQVDVEALLAAATPNNDAAAAVPPANQAVPGSEVVDGANGWTATWLGPLLIALGLIFLLSAGRIARWAVLARRLLHRRSESAGIAPGGLGSRRRKRLRIRVQISTY